MFFFGNWQRLKKMFDVIPSNDAGLLHIYKSNNKSIGYKKHNFQICQYIDFLIDGLIILATLHNQNYL
jgi:hypothetical protein